MHIREMAPADGERVVEVYAAGIATGIATFETTPPSWEEWDRSHLKRYRSVAVDDQGVVIGWVAASPVSDRCVYAGVIEVSVYVDPAHRGGGVGRALLAHFVAVTETDGVWTIQAGVFPENLASLRLHEQAGFRVVGRRERIGRLDGEWKDVVLLERRSRVVG